MFEFVVSILKLGLSYKNQSYQVEIWISNLRSGEKKKSNSGPYFYVILSCQSFARRVPHLEIPPVSFHPHSFLSELTKLSTLWFHPGCYQGPLQGSHCGLSLLHPESAAHSDTCLIPKIPVHAVYKFISSFGRGYLQYLENWLGRLEETQSTSPPPSLLTTVTSLEVLQDHPQLW